ncbi:MAG: DMT family transporter [Ectothiorhodospiraceae bacterium]|nr:DMT family transporter [Chromatiales bacterium]MCP5154467.1 DMT family transporter [Ectothiorhodospiraceae bacterium]
MSAAAPDAGARAAIGRAVLLAVASTALFSCMHAAVRHVGHELHPFMVAFFRSLFGVVAIAPVVLRTGVTVALRTRNPRLLLLRAALGAVSLLTWFYGLTLVPIAEATALSFSAAIFASIGAVVFLGERMGVRRWSAVAVGFLGALVVLRPGVEAVQLGSMLVLLSAVCWGGSIVLVKAISRTDATVTIVVWMAILLTVATFFPALAVWQWPNPIQLAWLAAIGLLGTIGTFAWTSAIKAADATLIIPTDFTRLLWASLIGYLAFTEVPDPWTWVGGAMILGSTFYIALREAHLARVPAARP